MPITWKTRGLQNDGFWAGAPSATRFEDIAAPTLILSCEDDPFGTATTSRLLAERIRGARLIVYPDGGHIWLGHDDEVTREIASFITPTARP
jgi:pimeloyl-ACP methyl ester carboxylesterase